MTRNDFVLDWDKALGFKADPFQDKIFTPVNDFLVNRIDDKAKLNWFFIKNYFYGAIVGEHGVGKTMLLKWLEDRLKTYNRIHCLYINAAVFKEQINIPQQLLMPLLTVYEKMITRPHIKASSYDYMSILRKKLANKSVAILIDNAHSLTDKNLELLKAMREEGLRLQIIVTSLPGDYEKSRLQELGNDELNLTLRRLSFPEAKDMIMRRIEYFGGQGIEPFNEELLKTLFERADKNPRQFIHLCRDEAIKHLIHRKEMVESDRNRPEAQSIKINGQQTQGDMNIRFRKPDKTDLEAEAKEEEAKGIHIKLAVKKDEDIKPPRREELKKKAREPEAISEADRVLRELSKEFEK